MLSLEITSSCYPIRRVDFVLFVSSNKDRIPGDHITLILSLLHLCVIVVPTAPGSRESWVKHRLSGTHGLGVIAKDPGPRGWIRLRSLAPGGSGTSREGKNPENPLTS